MSEPPPSAAADRPGPGVLGGVAQPPLSADEGRPGDRPSELPSDARADGDADGTGAGTERPDAGPDSDREAEGQETAEVVPIGGRRRRTARWVGIGVAAAAVVALIAGLLVSNVRLRDQKDDLTRIAAQRDATIAQLTANGPAKVAALTKDGKPSPDRRATLVVRGDHIEIIVESLGPTTGNETYWLWTLRCDTGTPTDLKPIRGFTVSQSDFSVRDIGSDAGVASAPCYAISSEEGTATPKAPREVVAVGQPS
jgi:hypothetical protein